MRTGSPAAMATPGELGVPGGRAHERDHRGREAEHLLHRPGHEGCGRPPARSHWPGASARATQAAGEEVPGRLVPGHQELDEEHGQLGVGELVPVDRGLGQLGEDVVGGDGPALLGQVDEEGDHLALELVPALLGPVGGPGDDGLGPLVEALPVLARAGP